MSWFNFYKKKIIVKDEDGNVVGTIIDNDTDRYIDDQNYIFNLEQNKGKFVPVYDDVTFENIPDNELSTIEEESKLNLPYAIIDNPKETTNNKSEIIKMNRTKRKYKPKRIPITPELRKQVYERYQGRCRLCDNINANQLHHIDKNPSNTILSNLELLCYECHLRVEGKQMYKYEKKRDDSIIDK